MISNTASRHDWHGATDDEIRQTIRNCPEDTEFDRGVKATLLWVMDAVKNQHPLDMERRLTVDLDGNSAQYLGDRIRLTPGEAEMLACLAVAFPNTATHETIKTALWGRRLLAYRSDRVMSCGHVKSLRPQLSCWGFDIENISTKGYRLVYPAPSERAA